jgi:plastocyanin
MKDRRTSAPRSRSSGPVLLAALALLVPGCGDPDDDLTSPDTPVTGLPPVELDEARIEIVDVEDGFEPAELTVSVEAEVRWVNTDGAAHTASADGGQWDSGTIGSGDTFTYTPVEPGRFAYFCTIHPQMTGTLIVE